MPGEWLGIAKIVGGKIVGFLPNWILKMKFNKKLFDERVKILNGEESPQFYVQKTASPSAIETITLKVVNLMPFPIELENIETSILIQGTPLGDLAKSLSLSIFGYSIGDLKLRKELTEKQADLVRNYGSRAPIFQMGGNLTIRSSFGRFSIPFTIQIRSIVYVE